MFYLDSVNNTSIINLPGNNCNHIFQLLKILNINNFVFHKVENYNYESICKLPFMIRINKSYKILLLCHPLERLWNIFINFSDYKDSFVKIINDESIINSLSSNFEIFMKFMFDNRQLFENSENNPFSFLKSYLTIMTSENNFLNVDYVVFEKLRKSDINTIINNLTISIAKFKNKEIDYNFENDLNVFKQKFEDELPNDYLIKYTEPLIKMGYCIYYNDFNHFGFKLPKIPLSMINYPLRDKTPVITIITPTLGNKSLIRLKKSLQYESVPYIHLILWDKNRVSNAIDPNFLKDSNTFCYEFTHPYHQFPGQRNDVWLRAVGVSLTNTPFVTFFDDDTWPNRGHLTKIMNVFRKRKVEYIHCYRRMWEDKKLENKDQRSNHILDIKNYELYNDLQLIGVDNFEAIGEKNKFGYRLVDNSSVYLKLQVARKIMNVFLDNQVYGDDRLTPEVLDNYKGYFLKEVLVNHVAKPSLLNFFKENIIEDVNNL